MQTKETSTQRKRRLEKAKLKRLEKLENESEGEKQQRLSKKRCTDNLNKAKQRMQKIRSMESQTEKNARNEKFSQYISDKRGEESNEQREARLRAVRERISEVRERETAEQREARLSALRKRISEVRECETADQREARLRALREHDSQVRESETDEQRAARISALRDRISAKRTQQNSTIETFYHTINIFCDQVCEICTKLCYPNQVTKHKINLSRASYLPMDLLRKQAILICHRCHTHLTSKKTYPPAKAYWNNLDPGNVPDEIKYLTEPEKRLISRIIPFVKIVKYDGLFGQYGFKGQAVLFAQDLFEFTNILPRSTDSIGMLVITEHLENLNISREYTVSHQRVHEALNWLVHNNPLYQDVIIDNNARILGEDLIRVQQPNINDVSHNGEEASLESAAVPPKETKSSEAYVIIENSRYILRASWHQGNDQVFHANSAGRQCCAMALANIARAAVLSPSLWTTFVLNSNMLAGDTIYTKIVELSANSRLVPAVDGLGYLEVGHFRVIKENLAIFNHSFRLEYDEETNLFGCLRDSMNNENIGMPLKEALAQLFAGHRAGILIAASKSLGVMNYDNKFYFTDSHACGPKGASASDSNGKACVIQCATLDDLVSVCKRAAGSANLQYTLNYIDVYLNNLTPLQTSQQSPISVPSSINPTESTPNHQINNPTIPVHTTMMAPIDSTQPTEEEVLQVSRNLHNITRKTKDNIVNVGHERKAEEFSWFYLLPYGVNGLNEPRTTTISPLDYFQHRILGSDSRFQRNDYLFYALSMFEYHRVKSTISACGKKVEGQEGQVDDVHLYLKNLRGSAAYWRTALNELLAQIRCLGPPAYFLTFSCNDLNWRDMRKALLIADGRPMEDPENLDMISTQRLIERYPVIVSRHFMYRFNALLKFLLNNHDIFSGRLQDYWWRIEFQNRGSPHIHMVVWVEGHASFETEEGLRQLDHVCSCDLPPATSELHDIVKKNQMHRHTHTCYKNVNTASNCRFGFPRKECPETRIVSHSSEEFIRNGGRICMLRRNADSGWINNYNPTLLKVWDANMDIQPCGTNEAIAFYIAKYVSKSEPTQLDSSVVQTIREIQRENTNISQKIFKICMRILNERQVSACECVFRLCHLKLRDSTRRCVFLNTRKPEERYRVLKFDENGTATGYCSNIFDRYEKRPIEHPNYNFPNMCLLEFAMLFEPYYAKPRQEPEECDTYEPENQTHRRLIALSDKSKIVIRNVPAVVRVPYFVAANDPENYFYSMLVQYVPYRNENELIADYNSSKEAFLAREAHLRETNARLDEFRERDKQLENAFNQIHAFDVLQEDPLQEPIEDEVEVPEQLMSDEEFTLARSAMNVGQREAFMYVTRSISEQINNGSDERLRLFITGNAGTGKTFLFNVLKNQVNRCYGRQAVKVCALTGVAARLVGGTTLHSALKFPVQKDGKIVQMPILTGNYLRLMRQQWQHTQFLFIDEISMVPYEMLCMVDSRLKQLKNTNTLFGGINICVFGDLLQLPPVRGNQVFDQPPRFYPAIHLWRTFTLLELKENMRQQGSTVFQDILNSLRVGELEGGHFQILMELVNKEYTGDFSIDRALRIYPTNDQVESYNKKVLEHFRAMGVRIYKIMAQDSLVDSNRKFDTTDLHKIIPSDVNKTGGLPKELEIFVGAKVMLRYNIDVSKGLVNGAIGLITEIVWPYYRRTQMYETDIPSVRIDLGNDGVHLISPKSVQFPAKFSYGTAERRMLPIILCWACTVHKMQGSTVEQAVVYLGPKLFASGQAYVALSRVRSLEGVRIEELDCTKLTGKRPVNADALNEMNRLRQI